MGGDATANVRVLEDDEDLRTLRRAHAQVRELMHHSAEVEDPLRHWEAEELSPAPHVALARLREEVAQLRPQEQALHRAPGTPAWRASSGPL